MLIKSYKIFLGEKPHQFIVSMRSFLWKENEDTC